MTKKDQKFIFYLLVSIFLTLGLTISIQPLLADWVAPNQSPPYVSGSLGNPIWNESAALDWYLMTKETWIMDDFLITKGGMDYFHVDTSDEEIPKVGIGTAAPVAELHVTSEEPGREYTAVRIANMASNDSIWELRALGGVSDNNDFAIWGGDQSSPKDNKLRIDGVTGNIGIGHNDEAVSKLDVKGDLYLRSVDNNIDYANIKTYDGPGLIDYAEFRWGERLNTYLRFVHDDGTTDREIMTIMPLDEIAAVNKFGRVGINDGSPNETLTVNGDISACGALLPCASDRRLKDVNGDFTFGLDLITELKPVYYNFKKDNPLNLDSSKEHIGLIAQDLEDIIPEAIIERENGYKTYDIEPINWALVNAVKELRGILCDLNPDNEICISK